jgi:1,4-alpha-glucan branching enzyme
MFMGEEYGETNPFLFFTDFEGELAQAVREGRAREFEGHNGYGNDAVPDPNALSTFENSKLDWQKLTHPEGENTLALTRKLLALRRKYIVPLLTPAKGEVGQIVETSTGFLSVKWTFPRGTLSLVLNVGQDTHPLPELPGETIFAWPQDAATSVPASLIVRFAPGVLL